MKKLVRIVSLAAAVAVLPSVVTAQDQQFKKDSKVFDVGLLVAGESYGGIGLGGGFEIGVAEIASGNVRLGVGAQIGYLKHTYGSYGLFSTGYSFTTIPILVFVNGHYQIEAVPKLDVYAGPVAGVSRYSYSCDSGLSYCSSFASANEASIGIHAGARYELTSAIAGSAEVSAGTRLPFLKVGVGFKF